MRVVGGVPLWVECVFRRVDVVCLCLLCFVPVLRGCVRYVCGYVRNNALLQCLCNYWEEGYGPVWGSLVYVFVGFWDGDYVSQLPYVWYYVGVKSSFQHAREECESKRAYVFRCLMFNLSGPCELLFLLCFIASWTWVVVSVILYPCILCVDLLVYLFV